MAQVCADYNVEVVMAVSRREGRFLFEKKEQRPAHNTPLLTKKFLHQISPDGMRFEGELNPEGARHGRGVLIWSDGSRYEGAFKNNYFQGFGRLTKADGDFYEGNWLKDKAHGYGRFVPGSAAGNKYEGHWIADRKHGQGKETYPDGTVFVGNFVQGMKDGMGEF